MFLWEGTTVPNSGVVENVYFNQNLEILEVVGFLEKLTYVETFYDSNPICILLATSDGKQMIYSSRDESEGELIGYSIYIREFDANTQTNNVERIFRYDRYDEEKSFPLQISSYSVNKYVRDYEGTEIPIGEENDKISELFSATPFREYIFELKQLLTEVADAIRVKHNSTEKISPQDFKKMILNIISPIAGVIFEDGELFINNDIVGAAQVNVEGDTAYAYLKLNDSEVDFSECTGEIELIDNNTNMHTIFADNLTSENIKAGINILGYEGTYTGINGVYFVDSELTIDNDTVGAPQVNIKGDSTVVSTMISDSTLDISDCSGDIYLIDNFSNSHSIWIENLTPENIKKDVTILGHTGTYESNLEGVTFNGTNDLTIDNDTYRYIYINHMAETYIETSGYLILHADVFIRSISEGHSVTATNLTPANIKKGVTILGVTGTYEGE